ncbi:MAG: zinc ABC transporter solute-binding protein [Clostridiales bacterium]|nr:zinc ABC transporter solute-binding protein [Clostridiales bacterium]
MKRILPMLLSLALVLPLFTGCSRRASTAGEDAEAKIRVVSTIFPGYDFARAVAGDHVELTMLLPPGSESHSFEPTPQDVIRIKNCDLFIYVGGDSDTWVKGILDSMDTSEMKILSMMDLVETVEEEIKEGMEDDHGHDHGELDPDEIRDRPLADWAGSWVSIEGALAGGELDDYVADRAKASETDFDIQKEAYGQRWKSDYPSLVISDAAVTWNGVPVAYQYIGYQLVEGDHGASVWYGFEAEAPSAGAPTYIAFNDHGTGGSAEGEPHDEGDDDDHEDDHAHETAHYHIRYGDEGFDALTAIEDWSPTYFPADASGAEMAEAMGAHGQADHAHEYDEHVWTSPVNAMRVTQAIADALCALDQANAAAYRANCASYVEELTALDAAFREVVERAARKTLLFGDRFPFRYFVDEYGLDYYAAFPGCSTETEPSAKTVVFLIDKAREEHIPVVFHLEFSNEKMADILCESTGAKKRLLHSCHNITKAEFERGVTYLDLMLQNVETLKEALH